MIEVICQIIVKYFGIYIILGVLNIFFGFNLVVWLVLNLVFLYEVVEVGFDLVIVNVVKIVLLVLVFEDWCQVVFDLVWDCCEYDVEGNLMYDLFFMMFDFFVGVDLVVLKDVWVVELVVLLVGE